MSSLETRAARNPRSYGDVPTYVAAAGGERHQVTSNSARRRTLRVAAIGVTLAATAASGAFYTAAQADDQRGAPAVDRQDPTAPSKEHVKHDLEGPFSKQQAQQREAALDQVLSGKKDVEQRGASKVVKLDEKKYVELGREKTDKIFTILVEFGDQVDNTTMFDPDGAEGPKPPSRSTAAPPVRCTTRSRSRTVPRTTAPPGARTSAATTSRTCTSPRARASTR